MFYIFLPNEEMEIENDEATLGTVQTWSHHAQYGCFNLPGSNTPDSSSSNTELSTPKFQSSVD